MARYFSRIPARVDSGTVFSRLGYKKRSTILKENFRDEISGWIEEALSVVRLEAMTEILEVRTGESGELVFSAGNNDTTPAGLFAADRGAKYPVNSTSLSKFLSGCSRALLMGITGGSGIMELIDSNQKTDMTKAVVLDAAAGEIVDNGLDYIASLVSRELTRESAGLMKKRFSPGYGDLALETQGFFHSALEMERIGVKLTQSFMLVPQKSVIALTGIIS